MFIKCKDKFNKTMVEILSEMLQNINNFEAIHKCHMNDIYFIIGKSKIDLDVLTICYNNNIKMNFYTVDDILYQFDNNYKEKLNHKYGRKNYLWDLGIDPSFIAKVKLSNIKILEEYYFGCHTAISCKQSQHGKILLLPEDIVFDILNIK